MQQMQRRVHIQKHDFVHKRHRGVVSTLQPEEHCCSQPGKHDVGKDAPFMTGVVRKASPELTRANEAATARERRRPIVLPAACSQLTCGGTHKALRHPPTRWALDSNLGEKLCCYIINRPSLTTVPPSLQLKPSPRLRSDIPSSLLCVSLCSPTERLVRNRPHEPVITSNARPNNSFLFFSLTQHTTCNQHPERKGGSCKSDTSTRSTIVF